MLFINPYMCCCIICNALLELLVLVDVWMDVFMDGWMNVWIDGWMNYHPISKLPFLSKIFERVISKQIIKCLSENELYPINQSAYRKNHSTETTIVSIFENIYNAIDKGNKVQLMLLDMSAAFDTISYEILLDRLEEIGIADKALDLLKSYITNRTYRTLINDIQSDEF